MSDLQTFTLILFSTLNYTEQNPSASSSNNTLTGSGDPSILDYISPFVIFGTTIPILQQLYYKHKCRNKEKNKETARNWGKGRGNFSLHEVKVIQSCPTLCDAMDYTVYGIFQARILEWVTCPFSRGSSQLRDRTQVSCVAGGLFTSWATLVCMAAN